LRICFLIRVWVCWTVGFRCIRSARKPLFLGVWCRHVGPLAVLVKGRERADTPNVQGKGVLAPRRPARGRERADTPNVQGKGVLAPRRPARGRERADTPNVQGKGVLAPRRPARAARLDNGSLSRRAGRHAQCAGQGRAGP
jgi:hypothetical protein